MTMIDDDELHAMLEARADRASLDLVSVVAEGRRRALEPVHAGSSGRSVGWPVVALSGLAAAAAVIVLVVVPLTFHPGASPTPSADEPTASVRGPAPTPHSADSPITAAELDPAMGDTTGFVGLTIALHGELVADPTPCPTAADCGLLVAGLSRPHTLVAVKGEDLPTLPASGRIEGIFAIRFTERTLDDGRMVFEDVGPIVPAAGGLAWPIPTLAAGGDGLPTGLIAATGWIVRTPLHPCPTGKGCAATEDYLTTAAYQPAQIDGSVVGPPTGTSIDLPAGSYDAWAPEPNAMAEGVEPRPATLLLRLVTGASWQVVGRLDPPPFVEPVAPPDPTPLPTPKGSAAPLPPAATERLPGGFPTAINGEPVLVGIEAQARWREATDDTSFLVGGWFDSGTLHMCSGPPGQYNLDPLEARGCPRYFVTGIDGSPLYPDGLAMPEGDGPIVLRVHTRDPGAAACTAGGRAYCLERTIVEGVVWFGDAGTAAAPIGPSQARSNATSVSVTEWRDMTDKMQMAVSEDVFTVPIACPTPWPTLLFSIHGDPRYGLVAVFPDVNARERFQAATDPVVGATCLDLPIERPADARWVGHDNMLVLLFADDVFATRLADMLADPKRGQRALPMTEPSFDRTLGTVTDYLVARATGEFDHAWGERLILPVEDGYAAWIADVLARHAANALTGRVEVLDVVPTEQRVGPAAWRIIRDPGVSRARIVRVTHDGATDPSLAVEEFVVIQTPDSEFRDWQLIQIGAP